MERKGPAGVGRRDLVRLRRVGGRVNEIGNGAALVVRLVLDHRLVSGSPLRAIRIAELTGDSDFGFVIEDHDASSDVEESVGNRAERLGLKVEGREPRIVQLVSVLGWFGVVVATFAKWLKRGVIGGGVDSKVDLGWSTVLAVGVQMF